MKRANLLSVLAMSVFSLIFATSCVDPDPAGEFDTYSEFVGEAPAETDLCISENRDISGLYFVRLQHQIQLANHILLSFDIDRTGDTYTIVVQPLKADVDKDGDPREDARTPAGDPIILSDVEMDANGAIRMQLEHVIVSGEANSLTWSEIDADFDLTITPCVDKPEFLCGKADLELYKPLATPTKGTFGAVLVDDIDMSSVAPISCEDDPE